MRRSQSEKMEIIRLVEGSDLSIRQTLKELQISKSTFYRWYVRYLEDGYDGLADHPSRPRQFWNRIPDGVRQLVVETALEQTDLSPRELACHITDREGTFISESSVYRILKSFDLITSPAYVVMSASDSFKDKTVRVNEMWQTDFTYLKVTGWGWYYLGTVLDDFSRYIMAWKVFTTMAASDVTEVLDLALSKSDMDRIHVQHRPRLLSDNGPCYVSGELKTYLEDKGVRHIRGAPYHPMTQGKIERWHRTMKNVIKLDNYYFPSHLEKAISDFVNHYNNHRYHEAIGNVTPADVYFGRHNDVLKRREKIKKQTLIQRRKLNSKPIAA